MRAREIMLAALLVAAHASLAVGQASPAPVTTGELVLEGDGQAAEFAGAVAMINGKNVGGLPLNLRLQAGRYLLEVEKAGMKTWRRWLDLKAGAREVLKVRFEGATVAPKKGTLLVAADVLEARVRVDGKGVGRVPVLVTDLAPGVHQVSVEAEGYPPQQKQVQVKSGATVKVRIEFRKGPSGALRIVTDPPGADVWVDGTRRGVAPVTVRGLELGKHLVAGQKDGRLKAEQSVFVQAGQLVAVKLTLPEPPLNPGRGGLRVTSNRPSALVFVDGRFVGKTPLLRHDVVAGPHVIAVRLEGYAQHIQTVKVDAGAVAGVEAQLEAAASQASTQPTSQATSAPVGEDLDVRMMTPRAASLVAPTYVVGEFSAGFPYLLMARMVTGIYDGQPLGADGGVALRTYGAMTEVGGLLRLRLLRTKPWALAMTFEVGGGGGPDARSTFYAELGGVASFQWRRWANLSLVASAQLYTDRHCPETAREDELDVCTRPVQGLSTAEIRDRLGGVRLMLGLIGEVPITRWLSLYGELDFAVGSGRYAFTDAFAGVMPEDDPHVYGRIGVALRR